MQSLGFTFNRTMISRRQIGGAGSSIRARMLAMTLAPLALVALAAAFLLVQVQRVDIGRELDRRGHLVATVLAESAHFELLLGNQAAARQAMGNIMVNDSSIQMIELLDPLHRPVLAYGEPSVRGGLRRVDVAIQGDSPELARGYVRVFMSGESLLQARRGDLNLALALLGAAFSSCALAAAWMARAVWLPLGQAALTLRQSIQGEQPPPAAATRLADLQAAVALISEALSSSRRKIDELVASRTRELNVSYQRVLKADNEKQKLLAQGHDLVEAERKRIAGEIHDSLNATLVAVRMWAEAIAAKAKAIGAEEIAALAGRVISTTSELYSSTRNIVRQLRPELLETMGLHRAMQAMVRTFNEAHLECRFEYRGEEVAPPDSQAITAFRVLQESLSNVVKHAEATEVFVKLEAVQPPWCLRITVSDNGKGMDAATGTGSGLGLVGMRERVAAIGGILSVSSDSSGTAVTALL